MPRQFLGKQNTSLILAGLILASRFRFAYLEEGDSQYKARFETNRDDDFAVNCRQLRYDIERLEHESAEFGLLDRPAFIAAYGEGNRAFMEIICETWDAEKAKLFSVLPSRGDRPPDRSTAQPEILEFFGKINSQNAAFLMKSIEVYDSEMSKQLSTIISRSKKP